jgi:predicted dehydrogenase
MQRKIRWGLMGAGKIVNRWIKGARQLEDMDIVAVASRTMETSRNASTHFQIPEALTYEALVSREDIDVVYIPVPHNAHKELAVLAMEHGKSVLVEKPAAINTDELQEMIDCARKNKVFFMEAVWTRFFPMVKRIKQLIGEDGIGDVKAINCAFSYRTPDIALQGRTTNINLAGGGLLDVGVYNLHFCDIIYDKEPESLTGFASIGTDEHKLEVDEQAVYIAQYDRGELASLASGVRTNMLDTAYIYGTKGRMVIPHFWKPTSMELTLESGVTEISEPVPSCDPNEPDEGFQYEIAHVNECLRKGLYESPVMTWAKSMSVMKQCDTLRQQWGLKYPFE